ncbi:hypothetical protein AAFC00_004279 [Neodothiora populina]|uniref:Phosphoglycerate mutase-like protein n=1 Tax=Neodothiora populina TaxID=2781224 RepID=A0ABR3PJ79_9PEZI
MALFRLSLVTLASAAFVPAIVLSPNPTCPESNGKQYTASNGAVFEVECGLDRAGNDITHVQIYSNKIADCIAQCVATEGCSDITMSGTACYLKSKAGPSHACSHCRAARMVLNGKITSITSSATAAPLTTTKPSATTFSIVTSAAAPSTASLPTVGDGTEYIRYSTVGGYFLQDLNTTAASSFDYTTTNFGLINQTYTTDNKASVDLTQWQRFDRLLVNLNQQAASNVTYKLLFIGRHGEGYHNAAQIGYGTPAWNCYWSELNGNGTSTWDDADLTTDGIAQAFKANAFWSDLMRSQKIVAPQTFYVSPLTRCLKTANYTYSNLNLPADDPFIPTVKELFRETISTHTCDHRSNKTYIEHLFPTFRIEDTLTETDEIWNGITAETDSAKDYRSKIALDSVFATDKAARVVSITTHSGEAASLLRVLGHRVFSLVTGAIIPVLVKAETVAIGSGAATTTTVPWTSSAWCTNGAPLSSIDGGACVCSGGVMPTATVLASVTAGF